MIFTMDHTQIQPIKGHPFLISCHVIPCFKMVNLCHSVRASGDIYSKEFKKSLDIIFESLQKNLNLLKNLYLYALNILHLLITGITLK